MDFENFWVQIAQSPIFSSVAGLISYGVLIVELLVCILLIIERTRIIGLYSSFFLMVSFTIYIYVILNYSENVPCSCGGILEKMGWRTHLIFNFATVLISSFAILAYAVQRGKKNNYDSFAPTSPIFCKYRNDNCIIPSLRLFDQERESFHQKISGTSCNRGKEV